MNKIIVDDCIKKLRYRQADGPFIVIEVTDEIDYDMADYFAGQCAQALSNRQEMLPIVINSGGGDVYALQYMLENLKSLKNIEIVTIVPSFAASAAVALFAAGTQRWIGPMARLMIHNSSVTTFSSMSLREIQIEQNELNLVNEAMFRQMGVSCGNGSNYFRGLVGENGDHDLYMGADDAIRHNLATEIGVPTFNTKIYVSTKLVKPKKTDIADRMAIIFPAGKKAKRAKKNKMQQKIQRHFQSENKNSASDNTKDKNLKNDRFEKYFSSLVNES